MELRAKQMYSRSFSSQYSCPFSIIVFMSILKYEYSTLLYNIVALKCIHLCIKDSANDICKAWHM